MSQFLVLLVASGDLPPVEAIRDHLRKFDTAITLGIVAGVGTEATKRLQTAARDVGLLYYTYHGRPSHGRLGWMKPVYEAFMHHLSQVVVFGTGALTQFVAAKAHAKGVPVCHG